MKDFVWLANDNSLIPVEQLKMTHPPTFPDIEATRCFQIFPNIVKNVPTIEATMNFMLYESLQV